MFLVKLVDDAPLCRLVLIVLLCEVIDSTWCCFLKEAGLLSCCKH